MVSERVKKLQKTAGWHSVENMAEELRKKRAWKMVTEFTTSCDDHPVSEWCNENRARKHLPMTKDDDTTERKYESFLKRVCATLEQDPVDAERYKVNQAGIKRNARIRAKLRKQGFAQIGETYEPSKFCLIGDTMSIDGPYEVPQFEEQMEWVLRRQSHEWSKFEGVDVVEESHVSRRKARREQQAKDRRKAKMAVSSSRL